MNMVGYCVFFNEKYIFVSVQICIKYLERCTRNLTTVTCGSMVSSEDGLFQSPFYPPSGLTAEETNNYISLTPLQMVVKVTQTCGFGGNCNGETQSSSARPLKLSCNTNHQDILKCRF